MSSSSRRSSPEEVDTARLGAREQLRQKGLHGVVKAPVKPDLRQALVAASPVVVRRRRKQLPQLLLLELLQLLGAPAVRHRELIRPDGVVVPHADAALVARAGTGADLSLSEDSRHWNSNKKCPCITRLKAYLQNRS